MADEIDSGVSTPKRVERCKPHDAGELVTVASTYSLPGVDWNAPTPFTNCSIFRPPLAAGHGATRLVGGTPGFSRHRRPLEQRRGGSSSTSARSRSSASLRRFSSTERFPIATAPRTSNQRAAFHHQRDSRTPSRRKFVRHRRGSRWLCLRRARWRARRRSTDSQRAHAGAVFPEVLEQLDAQARGGRNDRSLRDGR